jgi:hypothetical protein
MGTKEMPVVGITLSLPVSAGETTLFSIIGESANDCVPSGIAPARINAEKRPESGPIFPPEWLCRMLDAI